jgi:chromosome partitioning protein
MLISLLHALLALLARFPGATRFVVAVVGSKGGTLKSVTVATLAHVLAEAGFDVVIGDLDPQGSLTRRCRHARLPHPVGVDPVALQYVLPAAPGASPVVVPTKGTVTLFRGGRSQESIGGHQIDAHIAHIVAQVGSQRPTVVLLDTPPALGPATQAAMRAADLVLVPSEATEDGLGGIMDVVELHGLLGLDAPLHVLLTKVVGRHGVLNAKIACDIDAVATMHGLQGMRLTTTIPLALGGAMSSSFKLPSTVSAPRCPTNKAYRQLANEIMSLLAARAPRTAQHVSAAVAP